MYILINKIKLFASVANENKSLQNSMLCCRFMSSNNARFCKTRLADPYEMMSKQSMYFLFPYFS